MMHQKNIEEKVLRIFKKCGAILEGHFLLSSGLHSSLYLEKFQVLQYPKYTSILCKELAEKFEKDNIEVVVGPVTGGIILAHEVARHLKTRAIFTERESGIMKLRRSFTIRKGERVLIVEDILTTGKSVKEVIEAIKEHSGEIVGVGILIDRSDGSANFNVKTHALAKISIETYEPRTCPLCKNGIPFVKPGSK